MEAKNFPIFGTLFHPEKELVNSGPLPNLSRSNAS